MVQRNYELSKLFPQKWVGFVGTFLFLALLFWVEAVFAQEVLPSKWYKANCKLGLPVLRTGEQDIVDRTLIGRRPSRSGIEIWGEFNNRGWDPARHPDKSTWAGKDTSAAEQRLGKYAAYFKSLGYQVKLMGVRKGVAGVEYRFVNRWSVPEPELQLAECKGHSTVVDSSTLELHFCFPRFYCRIHRDKHSPFSIKDSLAQSDSGAGFSQFNFPSGWPYLTRKQVGELLPSIRGGDYSSAKTGESVDRYIFKYIPVDYDSLFDVWVLKLGDRLVAKDKKDSEGGSVASKVNKLVEEKLSKYSKTTNNNFFGNVDPYVGVFTSHRKGLTSSFIPYIRLQNERISVVAGLSPQVKHYFEFSDASKTFKALIGGEILTWKNLSLGGYSQWDVYSTANDYAYWDMSAYAKWTFSLKRWFSPFAGLSFGREIYNRDETIGENRIGWKLKLLGGMEISF